MELINIPGVGEKTVEVLRRNGIETVEQLLAYYPRTYREFHARKTNGVSPGEWVSLVGTLSRPVSRHGARVSTQVSIFRDNSGTLTLRWFNSPFVTRSLSPAKIYLIKGQITIFADHYQLVNPEVKVVPANFLPPDLELQPIYTPLGTLKSGHLRNHIKSALTMVDIYPDPLNLDIQSRYHLLDLPTTLRHIHFPPTRADLEQAIHRLAFDELYTLQQQALHNREVAQIKTTSLQWSNDLMVKWFNDLPYALTPSQHTVIAEIAADLSRPVSMHRLLQGEVGSGKTLVAAASALLTHSAGRQTLVLAPTQILAEQLHSSFSQLLPYPITLSLITQSSPGDPHADVVVGTQSLLSNKNSFGKVGLVIVDEQHRFGVEQRLLLTRFNPAPHFLQMTATPIPRTLSLTLFAHLDISRLHELPPGRLPTKTYFVTPAKRHDAYSWVAKEVAAGNQAFIVVPVIERAEENEVNPRQSVTALEHELRSLFPHLTLDILHGQLKSDDKTARLRAFREGVTQILVATSMIEVGIDIPSANLMVIEDAERFGLAQLHQLRGRVGRGGKQGHCLVMTSNLTPSVKDRLTYFVAHHDGEALSRYDLQSRGPGELFGTTQHGFFALRFASIYDEQLLKETADAVRIASI